jgi:DNA-binding NarL/FixJ family response regulator
MSDQIARNVAEAFQQVGKLSSETENLSERELEILFYLSEGYQAKEVAEHFFFSIKTARTHLRNIYKKLHARSRTEAVLMYLKK